MKWLSPKQVKYLDFLIAMTEKEIKVRYKMAFLGFLWIFLNPLLQMAVMGFIFHFFVPVKIDNYFLFLFVGLLPWNFFSMTVNKATPVVIFERNLIQKAKFPREILVLSIVLSNLFHFFISFIILLAALVMDKVLSGYSFTQLVQYFLRISLSLGLSVWLGLITSGFSLLFSALNVKYRDVNFILQAFLPLWFYLTPIVYTLNLLPQQFQYIFFLNPFTSIIQLYQVILLNQQVLYPTLTILNLLAGGIIALIGWKVFHSESPYFDDWV